MTEHEQFTAALATFQTAAADLARAWENVPGDILGASYPFAISFDEMAVDIQNMEIRA